MLTIPLPLTWLPFSSHYRWPSMLDLVLAATHAILVVLPRRVKQGIRHRNRSGLSPHSGPPPQRLRRLDIKRAARRRAQR